MTSEYLKVWNYRKKFGGLKQQHKISYLIILILLSNEKQNFLKYVVWQPLYMQTVTSAENGGTEKADFQVPTSFMDMVTVLKKFQLPKLNDKIRK